MPDLVIVLCSEQCAAMQNRDLNLRVQRLQDELNHARAAAPGQYDPATMTYNMRRQKAKADEETAAEAQKYKGLYDAGVSRIGKLQQEVERLKMEKEKTAKALKASQSKVASLEDQLGSFRAHSVCPGAATRSQGCHSSSISAASLCISTS